MLPPLWKSEIQKAIEETANADHEKREAQNNDAAAKITAAIDALSNAQQTQTSHEDINEKINVGLAILTIFLVFLTVIFTGLSWLTFRDQLTEMKASAEQTNKIIDANAKLVDAATKQAEAATDNAKIARDNFVASERAWVGPRNTKTNSPPAANQDLPILLDYGNTGREPAIETAYDTDVFTATEEEDSAGKVTPKINAFIGKCKIMWKPDQAAVIYPSVGLSAANYTLKRVMDKSDIDDAVISGAKIIFFTGCFAYKTTETIHRSWFCYFFKAGKTDIGNWNICQTGNGAD
ncbi:MAG TPA: hypothetical protein VK591_03970 [Xanthobacteraceae bacterium]|nr:hypothetical protein [Xanthobacteraceae bacterium]